MDSNYKLVRRIMLATNKIDGVYYLFGKRRGISANKLAFLYALSDGETHSQKEISDEWLMPRTTVNSTVKQLLAEGYIEFCYEGRKKEKALRLTDVGKAFAEDLFAGIFNAEEKAITDTLQNFSPDFVTALEMFCGALIEQSEKETKKETKADGTEA